MKKLPVNPENADVRFGSWLKQMVDQAAPKNLYLVIGRAGAKTTDILAERTMEVCYDMPGAYFAITADTYLNAAKNIIPGILQGWTEKGWQEGIHFVADQRPPKHFLKPYKPVLNYKHTLSMFNGCFFKIVSMDRPSTGAGDSYQHLFGDEAKYLIKKKLDKLIPAIRGEYVRFGQSTYYRGRSFTTDMPNVFHNENDWILDMEKEMDRPQILLALQAAAVLNEERIRLERAKAEGATEAELTLLEKNIERWELKHKAIRRNSTLFYIASSFINADILRPGFFEDTLSSLGSHEYYTSVLGIKPTIEKGSRFYQELADRHFYRDGIDYNQYDTLGLRDEWVESSTALRYVDHNKFLEGGFDAGNMMSLVIAQQQGSAIRCLKNFYTLTPQWIDDLGKNFTQFFAAHQVKVLHLYYDRAANQYSKAGKDFAGQLKQAIEQQGGIYTGWHVKLMSRNQADITHAQEFDLMIQLMGERNPKLPKLLIDQYQCRQLKSSLENAPVIIKQRGDKRTIQKDKSSEKELPLERLPLESTNFSDAFKYLLCRPEWLAIASNSTVGNVGEAKVR
jgi:hypothetical protein